MSDGAVGGAGAVEAAGKLVEVGFSFEGGTSIEQALHHGGVCGGGAGEGGAGGGGGPSLDVDVVLDGEAQAFQGAFFPGSQRWVWPVENIIRSVVFVLPASIWAIIPILRYFSSGY